MGKVSLTDNMQIQTLCEQCLLDRSTKLLDISNRLKAVLKLEVDTSNIHSDNGILTFYH